MAWHFYALGIKVKLSVPMLIGGEKSLHRLQVQLVLLLLIKQQHMVHDPWTCLDPSSMSGMFTGNTTLQFLTKAYTTKIIPFYNRQHTSPDASEEDLMLHTVPQALHTYHLAVCIICSSWH